MYLNTPLHDGEVDGGDVAKGELGVSFQSCLFIVTETKKPATCDDREEGRLGMIETCRSLSLPLHRPSLEQTLNHDQDYLLEGYFQSIICHQQQQTDLDMLFAF